MLGMQEGAYSFQKAVVSLIFAIITYQERENGKQTFSSQSYPVHVHVTHTFSLFTSWNNHHSDQCCYWPLRSVSLTSGCCLFQR